MIVTTLLSGSVKRKAQKMGYKKIDWDNAPPVPVHVQQAQAAGKDIGGIIETGPFGQKTFVPNSGLVKTDKCEPQFPGSVPGGAVHAFP